MVCDFDYILNTRYKEWGWFDAYERALELIPVGMPHVHEFQKEAHHRIIRS